MVSLLLDDDYWYVHMPARYQVPMTMLMTEVVCTWHATCCREGRSYDTLHGAKYTN